MGCILGEKGSEALRGCSSETSEGPAVAVLEGYGQKMGWEREEVRWVGFLSKPGIGFLRVRASWWERRSCRVTKSPAWLEFRRGMDGRDCVGGAGWMPVRRDLTGYMYELEGLRCSSLSGAFVEHSSPSCMIEVLGKAGSFESGQTRRRRLRTSSSYLSPTDDNWTKVL